MTCLAKVYRNITLRNFNLVKCVAISYHISALVVLILYNKYTIKTRKDSWHEVNILFALAIVPSAEYRVGSCENSTTRVQGCCDTSLEKLR